MTTQSLADVTQLPEDVTVVETALQLQSAVKASSPNIELRKHIDLTTIEPVVIPSATPQTNPTPQIVLLGILPLQVQSIRGNCTGPPSQQQLAAFNLTGVPLRTFKSRQCLVVVDHRVLDTSRGDEGNSARAVVGWHRLWLDGLYMRYKRTARGVDGYNAGMVSATSFSEVAMTAMTLQGDGDGALDCGACGVRSGGTVLYAEGCMFADLEGDMIIHTSVRSTTSLLGCDFLDNRGHPMGVLNARSGAGGTGAVVMVDRCTFSHNRGAHLLQAMKWQPGDRGSFYSDAPMHVFHNGSHWNEPDIADVLDLQGGLSLPLEEFPEERILLNAETEHFLRVQRILPKIPRDLLVNAPPETALLENTAFEQFTAPLYPPSSRALESADVAGISVATVALLLLVVAGVALFMMKRGKQERPAAAAAKMTSLAANMEAECVVAQPGFGSVEAFSSRPSSGLTCIQVPPTLPLPPFLLQSSNQSHITGTSAPNFNSSSAQNPHKYLEHSSEASGSIVPPQFSLLLNSHSQASGDVNATNENTISAEKSPDCNAGDVARVERNIPSGTFPHAFVHGGLLNAGSAAGGVDITNDSASGSNHPATEVGSEHNTASISWLAGDHRHAWRAGMQPPDVPPTIDQIQMHAQHGNSPLIHTLDAMHGQHSAAFKELQGTMETTFDVTSMIAVPNPPQQGDTLDRELLEKSLDNISNSRGLFVGQFELLGPMHRRTGGQGVVQFARRVHSAEGVAIKFFLNRHAFQCEEALYMRAELRGMMPAITLIESNESGVAMTEGGWKFPPFIVVEKGESLDEWQRHIQPDFPTIVQVLSHVAERVHTLHALGVAHRDLKPGNVLWRPVEHSWTLIDFGCAAEVGLTTRLTFSPAFAPPEALAAVHRGAITTVADTAADVWAIGVIAYELATKHPPFPVMEWNHDAILAAALGQRPYPWEVEVGVFRNVPELRILGAVVKRCLSRDAGQRPSAERVLKKLSSLFDSG